MKRCVCGCGRKGAHDHHLIYAQELRRHATPERSFKKLRCDTRNTVPIAFQCHGEHHSRKRPLQLGVLPDSVYEFAVELMGAGAAYEYLRRRYAGNDPRLDALLEHGLVVADDTNPPGEEAS